MKTALIIIRVILGIIYTAFSLAFFFKLMPAQEMTGNSQIFVTGLFAAQYIMPVVKLLELLCGLAFLTGRLVPLAAVAIFPITLNIFLFHVFLEPTGMVVSLVLLLGNLFVAFYFRDRYQQVLQWK